ncbi:hypothetical protein V5F53_04320 [Xanthobacter sp. V4C-4]|uniref:hypothetical protein n=1 Tax=Xanthobacter cornucopiae TaxID=3119924 RepID=UPI00372C472F
MPPLIIVALGALGAATLVKVIANGARRASARMEQQRATDAAGELKAIPLERDPVTGEYRPRQP